MEAVPEWRTAKCLQALRRQIDGTAPHRSRGSDGTIGDAIQASRGSGHNPWVRDGATGVVTTMDITHDSSAGCDAGRIAHLVVDSRDRRVKYVIWNRRIANASGIGASSPWTWRPYTGVNSHDHHVHVSVRPDKAAYDDDSPWRIEV